MMFALYAFLLRLYPRAFYAQFADEMCDVFAHSRADAAQHGRWALFKFYLRELRDLPIQALRQHAKESSMKHTPNLTISLGLILSSALIAALISSLMWGYAITPPASSPLVDQITTITSVYPVQVDLDLNLHIVERGQLPSGEVSDYPPSQIISAVQSRLPVSNPLPSDDLLARLREKMRWYGVEPGFRGGVEAHTINNGVELQIGEERHTYTADDHFYYGVQPASGFLIQGTNAQGDTLVFLNLGSRVGGDRHQYYAFLFSDTGAELSFVADQTYRYDVAGLEFFHFPLIFLLIFVLLAFVALISLAISAVARRIIKPRRLAQA